MALSQCLDDSLFRAKSTPPGAVPCNLQEVYNERHRLALEELLSAGVDDFLGFLRKESIANFLSDEEIQWMRGAAVAPRRASVLGEHLAPPPPEQRSLSSSIDCLSVTYFPEVSDVEPPPLEIGWPAFTAGSYRGVTRAVAHFQPSYGDSIYACKEAARKMISSAREVRCSTVRPASSVWVTLAYHPRSRLPGTVDGYSVVKSEQLTPVSYTQAS